MADAVLGSGPTIRAARSDDATRMVELFAQLGYRVDVDSVAKSVETFGDDDAALVGEIDGAVVAVGVLHRTLFLNEGGYRARLTSLVVDEQTRSSGIGSVLLQACERLARSMGCATLELTTATTRHRAHAFYERQGYEHNARRYFKNLDAPATIP